jgi:hypothetical protein
MKLLVLERQFDQEYADIGNLSMNISRFYASMQFWWGFLEQRSSYFALETLSGTKEIK